jgi:predicted outer membrane protein
MRSGLRFFGSLGLVLVIGGTVAGCGDDDVSDGSAQTGTDASMYEGGTGGKATSGRGGTGGSRPVAGRSGSAGATAGRGEAAGTGGTPSMQGGGGRGSTTAGRGGATAAGGTGGSGPTSLLSDAQIAAVTTAANSGEISLGNLALSRARLAEVRAFGQEMITMHGAAQDRSTSLLQSLNITPVQSNLSATLEQDTQRVAIMLQNAPAADFDLAYVQSQIDIHTQVLQIFDTVLIPSVTSLPLRTDLTLARADVQRHLVEAQALLLVVQAAPPDLDAGTEDAGL